MYYPKNTAALRQHGQAYQFLLDQLSQVKPIEDYALFPTADGNYTLQYQGMFLHDPDAPMQEIRNTLKEHCTPSPFRVHVILGIGLGYLLDQTFKASEGRIVVYEPDLRLLRFILENVDLSEFLASNRVELVANQRELIESVRYKTYRQFQLDILVLRGSAYFFADEIPGLMARLQDTESDRIQDVKTGKFFHEKWLKQFFENLPFFAKHGEVGRLVGKFKDKPALVISRGPSLDHSIDAVKALADSAVLIAVGGAIRRLWEAGVIPDFAVFLDANGMQEQLHGIPQTVLDQIIFLPCPTTQRCVFTTPSRGKLVFHAHNAGQLCDWADRALETKHHRLRGGGTVSLVALQTAMAMQCNPIILVGQDLAFPNNQVYAGNIPLVTNEEGKMTLPGSATLFTAPETMATTPGQQGESLPTLKAYLSFIRHFEELASKNASNPKPVALYNTSLGGAKIDGYTLRNLAEFIPELKPWKQGGPALPEAPAISPIKAEARRKNLLKSLRKLRFTLQEAIVLYQQSEQVLEELLKDATPAGDVMSREYRKIVRFLQRYPFVNYIALYEHVQFRNELGRLDTPKAQTNEGCQALLLMLGNSRVLFQTEAMAWIDQAEAALQEAPLTELQCGEPMPLAEQIGAQPVA